MSAFYNFIYSIEVTRGLKLKTPGREKVVTRHADVALILTGHSYSRYMPETPCALFCINVVRNCTVLHLCKTNEWINISAQSIQTMNLQIYYVFVTHINPGSGTAISPYRGRASGCGLTCLWCSLGCNPCVIVDGVNQDIPPFDHALFNHTPFLSPGYDTMVLLSS